jgi:STE24 endopeptidase
VQRRSYLSLQVAGIPSETLYWILLTVWPISGLVVFYQRTEELLARWFHRFRPPSALEMQRIGPAWWAVCTAAGVDPDRFRVWIYEGPVATAPIR